MPHATSSSILDVQHVSFIENVCHLKQSQTAPDPVVQIARVCPFRFLCAHSSTYRSLQSNQISN
eukprot:11109938-Karenia_brevis.AAC.1